MHSFGGVLFCFVLNRYKNISEKSHNPVGGLKRKITLFSLLNRCLLCAQSTPRTRSTRDSSCFLVVLCVSSIGETGWQLGYKKTCSGRAPDEEESGRTRVRTYLNLQCLGEEVMLEWTHGGRVGRCQTKRTHGGGSSNSRWKVMEVWQFQEDKPAGGRFEHVNVSKALIAAFLK